jgi:hypothetical protein
MTARVYVTDSGTHPFPENPKIIEGSPGNFAKTPDWVPLLYVPSGTLDRPTGYIHIYNDNGCIYELKLEETSRRYFRDERHKHIEALHVLNEQEIARRFELQDPDLPYPEQTALSDPVPGSPAHIPSPLSDQSEHLPDLASLSIRETSIPPELQNSPISPRNMSMHTQAPTTIG